MNQSIEFGVLSIGGVPGGGRGYFQVPGLSHRDSGSGFQVQVQVPGLKPVPEPVPVPAAET